MNISLDLKNSSSHEISPNNQEISSNKEQIFNKEYFFFEKASKIYETLEKTFDLRVLNGKIIWSNNKYTYQEKESLVIDLFNSLKILQKNEMIAIRLKERGDENTDFQKRTFVVLMQPSGEIFKILEKKLLYATGSYKKTCQMRLCDLKDLKTKQKEEILVAFKYLQKDKIDLRATLEFKKENNLFKFLKDQKIDGFEAPCEASGIYIKGFKQSEDSCEQYAPTFFTQCTLYEAFTVSEHKDTLFDLWGMQKLAEALIDLCQSLHQCHELGITLGDIKIGNLLIKDGRLFFTDLGGAWEANEKNFESHHNIFTPGYFLKKDYRILKKMDKVENTKIIRQKIDIFSLGITIYKMISSVRLHDENYSDDFNKITDDSLGKQFEKNIEKKLGRNSPYLLLITNLVKQMCNLDYGGRPRLPDIIKSLEEIANIVDPKFLESSDKKIKKNKKCNIF